MIYDDNNIFAKILKGEIPCKKIYEAADVFYHLIMYLEANDINIEDVMTELDKRKK